MDTQLDTCLYCVLCLLIEDHVSRVENLPPVIEATDNLNILGVRQDDKPASFILFIVDDSVMSTLDVWSTLEAPFNPCPLCFLLEANVLPPAKSK
jgi:hypothetical protein